MVLVLKAWQLIAWALESGSLVLHPGTTLTVQPWGGYITFRCFGFLSCKMGLIICSPFRVIVKMKMRRCQIQWLAQCKHLMNVSCYYGYYFLACGQSYYLLKARHLKMYSHEDQNKRSEPWSLNSQINPFPLDTLGTWHHKIYILSILWLFITWGIHLSSELFVLYRG